MVDLATERDLDALKEIWLQCFGGSVEYLNFFYNNRFIPEDTLVWREDGKPVSMMTLMEIFLGGKKGYYIYAVATLPLYQKQGLMRKLDMRAVEVMKERGASFCCLVPAEPPLFPMYEKLGYHTDFFNYKGELHVDHLPASEHLFFPCNFGQFESLRKKYLAGISHGLSHPTEELHYIFRELRQFNGNVLLFLEHRSLCYVAYNYTMEGIFLRETNSATPEKVALSLMRRHDCLRATIASQKPFPGGNRTPYGMGRVFGETGFSPLYTQAGEVGYMALMLD